MADRKDNTGIDNTGEENSGNGNSGNKNSGNGNSGNGNSGDWNSGDWNSGDWNSGNWNSGNGNTGNGNSGNGNSGNWNSGDWNSGNWNSGYGNSTDRESGIFCSSKGKVRIFNKPTNLTWDDIDHPHFGEFYTCQWIPEEYMTDEEKKSNPEFYVRGGYLKTYEYKEAWANFWRDTDEDNREKFLALPNFDSEVFKNITGIDVGKKEVDLHGSEVKVTVDGKEYVAVIK